MYILSNNWFINIKNNEYHNYPFIVNSFILYQI